MMVMRMVMRTVMMVTGGNGTAGAARRARVRPGSPRARASEQDRVHPVAEERVEGPEDNPVANKHHERHEETCKVLEQDRVHPVAEERVEGPKTIQPPTSTMSDTRKPVKYSATRLNISRAAVELQV